jgi:flagellar basal-body rod protein FlgF
MIYGMYLSASGMMTSTRRQDVIANNLANAETVGFKRQLALFQTRPPASEASPVDAPVNEMLSRIGGGLLFAATATDLTQGDLDDTGNGLDLAILGKGYFAVQTSAGTRLTRDGRFMMDRSGNLVTPEGHPVLDDRNRPIALNPAQRLSTLISEQGEISQAGEFVNRIGLFDVSDPDQLRREGNNLLSVVDPRAITPSNATVRPGFVERANVNPATELVQLIEAQRQLEANANMIRYQDQTLARLVNDVPKLS